MKRLLMVIALPVILAGVSLAQGAEFSQAVPGQATPDPSDGFLGRQLIAWTEMQKPSPLSQSQSQQPLPPPDTKPDPQNPAAPASEKPNDTNAPKADAPQPKSDAKAASDSISGTITKSGSKYVLQTTDSVTYQIDDQTKAKEYEGKRVKITGVMDSNAKTIRVSEIEVLS